ncbi:uncharacterized protein [Diadema setosum]|uniref:uncharacterized protein n=1 Tax=Diadema setosum TaxID=31175 RepID=UPI003B3A965A
MAARVQSLLSTFLNSEIIIKYIWPTPLQQDTSLYISFIAERNVARKRRSAESSQSSNSSLVAVADLKSAIEDNLGNFTALSNGTSITITEGFPSAIAQLIPGLEQSTTENITNVASIDITTTEMAATNVVATNVATTDVATTDAATTDAATTKAATTDAATTKAATTDAATTKAATTKAATTDAATTDAATTNLVTTKRATTDRATTNSATTNSATTNVATTVAATGTATGMAAPKMTTSVVATTNTETAVILTTRKSDVFNFFSNPGLFISLVVIATISIIIIIVGLIYLLCDRRRGRSGEYITNHSPRNSDLELGFDNPVMAENDKAVPNGNGAHLLSVKADLDSDMIVPYDNFTQEELMNYEVEDTHL